MLEILHTRLGEEIEAHKADPLRDTETLDDINQSLNNITARILSN